MVDTFARQRQLIGSTAEWAVDDMVLALGEIGIEQVSSVDIRIKVGNGVDPWSMLPYISTFTSNINDETLDAIAAQVSIAGDTMTGPLILFGDPVDVLGAVTKQYADAISSSLTSQVDARVIKTGDTMTGFLSHDLAPTAPAHSATKAYVDSVAAGRVNIAGDTMTGPLLLSGAPTSALHAATKDYVDNGDYQSVVGGSIAYAGKVVKLNASGMLDTSIVPISSVYIGTVNLTLSYTLTGSFTVGSYFAVQLTGTIDASWNTKINGAPSACSAGQVLIYNANGKWDLVGEPVSSSAIAGKLDKAGGTMTGALILAADPTAALGAATKQYVDTRATVSYVDAQIATRQVAGSYATAAHTHIIADVTGLQTALDGKADSSHTHTIANVTGLQTALDGKQAAGNYADTGVANTFSANQIISVTDNTNAALRITQLGTGLALRVEDSANPDSTPFAITAAGVVIVGNASALATNADGSSVTPQLQVAGTGINDSSFGVYRFAASSGSPRFIFSKSRGASVGTNTVVVSADVLGQMSFSGADGTAYVEAARIAALVDGTPGTNDMPGRLVFYTTADGASSTTERLRIDNAGNVLVTSTGGLGYGTGSGGSVTQATDKTTGVTLNKTNGLITTAASALAAGAAANFLVTNSTYAITDTIVITSRNGNYSVRAAASGAGAFVVYIKNETGGSLSEAVNINFSIIKSVTA